MKLSIVIPVLNSERTLPECLAAIRAQTLRRDAYEIVVADAGSTGRTLEIAREMDVDVVTGNPLKTGEAGKTAGIKAASGDIVALVDSDNILPDPSWRATKSVPPATRKDPSLRKPPNGRATLTGSVSDVPQFTSTGVAWAVARHITPIARNRFFMRFFLTRIRSLR